MTEGKREFKGVWIPKEIWLNEDLTLQEKVFFVEINSLDNEDGCYANNEYFAKFFGVSKVRVSEVINSLVGKGFIESLVEQGKGNKRTLKTLANFPLRPSQTLSGKGRKLSFKHSNTINNTINNIPVSSETGNLFSSDKPLELTIQKKEQGAREQMIDFWLKEFHPGWSFRAVHGKAVNSLIKKIRERKTVINGTEEQQQAMVVATFKLMCQRLPDWFKDKDLQILDSKFNEIIHQIQTGNKNDDWTSKNSAQRFSDFAGRV